MPKLKWLFIAGLTVLTFTLLQLAPALLSNEWRMEATFEVVSGDMSQDISIKLDGPHETLESLTCTYLSPSRVRCSFVGESLFDAKDYLAVRGVGTTNRFIDTSTSPIFMTPTLLAWQTLLATIAWIIWWRWIRLDNSAQTWSGQYRLLLLLLPYAAATTTAGLLFALFGVGVNVKNTSAISIELNAVNVALLGVIVAPIYEEVLFRGIALDALRRVFPWSVATLLTSLSFVSMHSIHSGANGVSHVAALFASAVALCWIRRQTGSLILCVFAHALFNAIVLATALRMQ